MKNYQHFELFSKIRLPRYIIKYNILEVVAIGNNKTSNVLKMCILFFVFRIFK